MTLTLFVFHLIVLLMILPMASCSSIFHDGAWALKFIGILGCFTGFFWIDISVFETWSNISRFVSIFFMVIQALYILIGSYTLNEILLKAAETNQCFISLMTVMTILINAACFGIIWACFVYFTDGEVRGDD
mmetsp:Transcript_13524/g.23016  ORF Transcript_13524/g.23016 Transcript_13524/m.23016 type:complete len:132 (+) Transcript_13524:301-696(+)